MRDVFESIDRWHTQGEQIALATVVKTWGSAPRPVGAKMAFTARGGLAGSVSGGCVEGAVIDAGQALFEGGEPQLLKFGVADEDAWEVGLACGGTIHVFVEPFSAFSSVYEPLKARLVTRQPAALVSMLNGLPEQRGHKLLIQPDGAVQGNLTLSPVIINAARDRLESEQSGILETEDERLLFVDVFPPPPRLIVIGAVHIADALVAAANLLDFETIVIDPRTAFATRVRFPHVDKLYGEWPQRALPEIELDRSTYIAVLTHDPKIDDPALQIALRSNARYIGALGSRRTHEKRIKRLREAGLTAAHIERLHAPIGLPLGGRSPSEIALSIIAEMVQIRHQTR